MDISPQLERYFTDLQSEMGSPFDKWRIAAKPDYRHDEGYPAACYWLYDHHGKAHAFSFALRYDQPSEVWIKDELKGKLLEILKAAE